MLSTHNSLFSTCLSFLDKFPGYPGSPNAKFTEKCNFIDSTPEPIPMFQIMNQKSEIVNPEIMSKIEKDLTKDGIINMYKYMIRANTVDTVLLNSQRQGRISFFMTNYGEYGSQIGISAALKPEDLLCPQYREMGVFLYRGVTMESYMDQCFGTVDDEAKGRQMPVHYGSKDLNIMTISSPLGTQLPQAAGYGYALSLGKQDRVCCTFMGDGSASEGDFHAGMNFASTLGSQTLFVCRNNGFAISTPVKDQYKGDGIAARGIGYGMKTIRVDGCDMFASYYATKLARDIIVKENRPVLLETMQYRVSHHSTSDDSSRYRTKQEIKFWEQEHNPVVRIKNYLMNKGWWTEEEEKVLVKSTKKDVMKALTKCSKKKKTPINELVTDVFAEVTPRLQEQYDFTKAVVSKYPKFYEKQH